MATIDRPEGFSPARAERGGAPPAGDDAAGAPGPPPARRMRLLDVLPLPAPSVSIFKSPLFLPGVLTALATGMLVYAMDKPRLFQQTIGWYFVLVVLLMFYQRSGLKRRWISLVVAAGVVALILKVPLLSRPFFYVFRELPVLIEPQTGATFWAHFRYHFVAAGLMEELMKAIPALVGLAIVLAARFFSRGQPLNPILGQVGVATPMQGLMMGMAAGAAFTLVETLGQYVPATQSTAAGSLTQTVTSALATATSAAHLKATSALETYVAQNPSEAASAMLEAARQVITTTLVELRQTLAGQAHPTTQSQGEFAGLMLLMPRMLTSLAGHMAYAGILGYFIGLAALARASAVVPLLLVGWIGAAALHALWNAAAVSLDASALMVVGVATFVALLTYYMKAEPEAVHGTADG